MTPVEACQMIALLPSLQDIVPKSPYIYWIVCKEQEMRRVAGERILGISA